MDYKEKYEQAILRMNKWVEGSEIIDPKEVAEFVFPEFKEPEDERIRKEIVDYLKSFISHHDDNLVAKSKVWIAWLEKQGEHANFRNKIQIGDEVTRNEDGVLVNLSQFKRVVKQGEQKPAWSEEDETVLNNLIYALANDRIGNCRYEYVDWLKSLKEIMKGE